MMVKNQLLGCYSLQVLEWEQFAGDIYYSGVFSTCRAYRYIYNTIFFATKKKQRVHNVTILKFCEKALEC